MKLLKLIFGSMQLNDYVCLYLRAKDCTSKVHSYKYLLNEDAGCESRRGGIGVESLPTNQQIWVWFLAAY